MPTDDVMPVQTWVLSPLFWLGRQQNSPKTRDMFKQPDFTHMNPPRHAVSDERIPGYKQHFKKKKKKNAHPRGQKYSIPGF